MYPNSFYMVGKEGNKEERNRLNWVYQEWKKGIAAVVIKQILSHFSVVKVWCVDICVYVVVSVVVNLQFKMWAWEITGMSALCSLFPLKFTNVHGVRSSGQRPIKPFSFYHLVKGQASSVCSTASEMLNFLLNSSSVTLLFAGICSAFSCEEVLDLVCGQL